MKIKQSRFWCSFCGSNDNNNRSNDRKSVVIVESRQSVGSSLIQVDDDDACCGLSDVQWQCCVAACVYVLWKHALCMLQGVFVILFIQGGRSLASYRYYGHISPGVTSCVVLRVSPLYHSLPSFLTFLAII